MKRALAIMAASFILGSGLAIATTGTANADTPGCVSQSDFRQARNGFGKARVHRLFDTAGRRDAISHAGGYAVVLRSYRACTRFGAVSVVFENGRLSTKSAVF